MDSQTRKTKPKYEIIKEALLARIHAGDFSFDESFCTEKMLSDQYHVSRITAKRAIEDLEQQGIELTNERTQPEARCWKLCFAKPFTRQQSNRYAENDFSSSSVRHHTGKYFGGNRKLKRCAG